MAVTKELLQMDLYALLGIEEKAADKEVRTCQAKQLFGPRAWLAPAPAFYAPPYPGLGSKDGQ